MTKLVLSEGHITPDSPISVQPGHVREDHERQRKGNDHDHETRRRGYEGSRRS